MEYQTRFPILARVYYGIENWPIEEKVFEKPEDIPPGTKFKVLATNVENKRGSRKLAGV